MSDLIPYSGSLGRKAARQEARQREEANRRRRAEAAERRAIALPIRAEVQEAAMKVRGAEALENLIMESVVRVDGKRRHLAYDESVNMLLSKIQMEGVQQKMRIQANLYNDFDLS